jgi:hypothetical protein
MSTYSSIPCRVGPVALFWYITQDWAARGLYNVCDIADADVKINDPLNKAIRTTIAAKVDRKTARIVELTDRIDFL